MHINASEVAALLEWYSAVGVDEAIADAPRNWFAEEPTVVTPNAAAKPASQNSVQGQPKRREPASLTASSSDTLQPQAKASDEAMAARELARNAASLDELRSLLEAFDGCPLKKTATNLCLARGSSEARVMFIGEAPGKDEDAQGVPFVGRAGQLLDRMLASINLIEDDCYITNLVFWRPPGNRTPSPQEVQACQPFLERQIELVAPEILVFLGSAAAKQLIGATEGIMKLRGKWLTYPPATAAVKADTSEPPIRALATLHPAYLLRNPIAKRLAWRDLLLIREAFDAVGS